MSEQKKIEENEKREEEQREEKKDIVEEAIALSEEEFEAEVQEIKSDIKRWQREDEQEFLRRIGFHERAKDDKIQFIKKLGDAVIGRTYNEKYKNGKFWGIRDGKQMTDQELKKIEDIQRFYAFRRGEIAMPEPPAKTEEVREMKFKPKGKMYRVGDHEEPDSGLAQQWGNAAKISLEIREPTEQTSDYAKAVVRAILPDGQFIDECVIHYYDISKERIAFEEIEAMQREGKKPIEGFDDEGRPILTAEAKYRIYKRYVRFKDFSVRDAITKAGRRAILKILNYEWREPEEIESEAREVQAVQEERRRYGKNGNS